MKTVIEVAHVLLALFTTEGARRATKYVSPNLVITATRRLYQGKIDKRGNVDVVLKIGRPNYGERKFIRAAKKAGRSFPIKDVVLRRVTKKK